MENMDFAQNLFPTYQKIKSLKTSSLEELLQKRGYTGFNKFREKFFN